ncbi:uncharacterized protein LOC129240908 [Anastrepha obliqua]|uniref:uncharacterized protein LOC129240908 n=1 Tax=Anastrepha obliqua TaxID=95512 RepID=UPI00240A169F|nr:uncharacterized protein LOC129240908 [Anastrepha obliqua]
MFNKIYFIEMPTSTKYCWVSLIYFLALFRLANSYVKLTNIQCTALDKPFADFQKCRLSVPKRGVVALSVHVKLFQILLKNVSINLSMFKKANGYRPFLYNVSADFCAFMANRSRYPFLKMVVAAITKDSNINHTCPYNNDIIVENLVLRDGMFGLFPVPEGDYMFKLMVGVYNEWKAHVKTFFSIKLDTKYR